MTRVYFILFFAMVVMSFTSCKDTPSSDSKNLTRKISFKQDGTLQLLNKDTDSVLATFKIEIADNDYKTQTGLMYRSSMGDDEAMLFIFPDSRVRACYIKN